MGEVKTSPTSLSDIRGQFSVVPRKTGTNPRRSSGTAFPYRLRKPSNHPHGHQIDRAELAFDFIDTSRRLIGSGRSHRPGDQQAASSLAPPLFAYPLSSGS